MKAVEALTLSSGFFFGNTEALMSEIQTITIGENDYALRQWPALPGWKFTRVILRALADAFAGVEIKGGDFKNLLNGEFDFKLEPDMVDKVLSDAVMAQVIEMLAEGLNASDGKEFDEKERKELRKAIAKFAFPDFVGAIIGVLRHNLVFLKGHVTALFQNLIQKGISTQPALASRASAESVSTPS